MKKKVHNDFNSNLNLISKSPISAQSINLLPIFHFIYKLKKNGGFDDQIINSQFLQILFVIFDHSCYFLPIIHI